MHLYRVDPADISQHEIPGIRRHIITNEYLPALILLLTHSKKSGYLCEAATLYPAKLISLRGHRLQERDFMCEPSRISLEHFKRPA